MVRWHHQFTGHEPGQTPGDSEGHTPGSPVPEILQARPLEWVAISFSKHESEK